MLKPSPRSVHLSLMVGLLSLVLAGGVAVAAEPAALGGAAPYGVDIYQPAAFSSQLGRRLSFGAAVQTMRNHVDDTAVHTKGAQRSYARYQRKHARGRTVDAQLRGWEDALDKWVAGGGYDVVRSKNAGAALKLAAIRLRKSGNPVGVVVPRKLRPLIIVGFTATADPAAGNFKILTVSFLDTGHPRFPVLSPGSDAPLRTLGRKRAGKLVARKGAVSILVPAVPRTVRKVALGLSQHPDNSLAALDAVTARHGRAPAIWSLWSAWGDDSGQFPSTALLDGIVQRGAVPILFWNPYDPGDPSDPSYGYRRIVAGDHDAYIRAWAQAAKAWDKTILLRFAQEMNGTWFPWGIPGRVGNTAPQFVAAWRHIHDIVRGAVGARKVRFVWSPYSNAGCGPTCPGYARIWPGDRYVDYAGFSVFDWGGNVAAADMFRPPVQAIKRLTRKPIIVAETGTPAGPRKASWILGGYRAVYRQFPRIVAIVYFDVRVHGQPDWRLTRPAAAEAAYRRLLADPRFRGAIK